MERAVKLVNSVLLKPQVSATSLQKNTKGNEENMLCKADALPNRRYAAYPTMILAEIIF